MISLPVDYLPSQVDRLSWDQQACYCLLGMANWASEQNQTGCLLMILPRDIGIQKMKTSWTTFEKSAWLNYVVFMVDGQIPKDDRQYIRRQLFDTCWEKNKRVLIILATSVFADSISLPINGVMDSGARFGLDKNWFRRLYACVPGRSHEATQVTSRASNKICFICADKLRCTPYSFDIRNALTGCALFGIHSCGDAAEFQDPRSFRWRAQVEQKTSTNLRRGGKDFF